jgi:UDP-N-acetylmuramate--alanine ligase
MSDAPWGGRRLHFIGIGGAGMSGLALVALGLGARVSGSDRAESSYSQRLREAGIEPAIGHDPANLPEGADVVVSTAIAEDNPELAAARAAGLRVLHRGELLGEVSRLKRCIAVGGTHGKTTTASMAAHALVECGRRPAYLIGGEVRSTGTNASWGQGDWVVVEADESDRSFLRLEPDVAVVTNVELDHHSTYRTLPEVREAFAAFAGPAPTVILPAGLELRDVPPAVTFGIDTGTFAARDLELLPSGTRFSVEGVPVELRVPGRHNVLNALAALAACREAGLGVAEAAPALAGFSGAGRRFEPHGRTAAGALVYDDYAHHPTEIAAILLAAREVVGNGRLVVAFQAHHYYRTADFCSEFGQALGLADDVVVMEVYAPGETMLPGGTGAALAAAVTLPPEHVVFEPSWSAVPAELAERARPGDLVLTMGAGGDVAMLGPEVLEALRQRTHTPALP